MIAVIAGGFSLAWVIHPGELPDQVVRAGIVIAVALFLPLTAYTSLRVSHRVCIAASGAVLGVAALLGVMGRSWHELHWWVEYRVGYTARMMMRTTWSGDGAGRVDVGQIADILGSSVRFVADYHPALVTLQIMAGLTLATAVYQRLASEPRGLPLGRFGELSFTEHLGWAAIATLIAVLVPQFSAVRLGAMNVLLVLGTLFALRGVSVATVGINALGGGFLTYALSLAAAFLLLPVALVGAILLGIVDTSFDLRRRWHTPPVGG